MLVPGGQRDTHTRMDRERFREGNSAPCPTPPAAPHHHRQHTCERLFSRTWDFLFNENTKEDKKRKKIKIYSEKSHIHQMFLK